MTPQETLEAFKKTRWWKPLVLRYRAHMKIRKEEGMAPDPFSWFMNDVMNTPEENRDELLEIKPLEPYEPSWRYPAYIEPTKAEQKLDFYTTEMGRKLR